MRKHYLRSAFLLTVFCCFLMLSAIGTEAAGAEARIGNRVYSTVNQAVKSVKSGETITLLEDIKRSSPIIVNRRKRFTLNLNGKNYKNTGRKGQAAFYVVNGQMTVRKGNMSSSVMPLFKVKKEARLVLESGKFNGMINNYGSITVKDGDYYAIKQKKWLFYNKGTLFLKNGNYKAYGNTVLNEKNGITYISGGEFSNTSNKNYPVIYNRSGEKGKLVISGGRFTGDGRKEVVYNKSGKCYLKGGTIESRIKRGIPGRIPAVSNGESGVMYISKAQISHESYAAVGNSGKLTVSGGILMGDRKYALLSNRGEMKITGGYFRTFDRSLGYSIYNWPEADMSIRIEDYESHFDGRIMDGQEVLWSPTVEDESFEVT